MNEQPQQLTGGGLGTLRRKRIEAGLHQAELARLAGCSVSHISHMELGIRRPGIRQLHRLASALGCPVTDLMYLVEDAA